MGDVSGLLILINPRFNCLLLLISNLEKSIQRGVSNVKATHAHSPTSQLIDDEFQFRLSSRARVYVVACTR